MNNKTTRNSLLLLVTAAVWGAAFVAQTVGGQAIGAYSFNCIRSIIGALVLIPVMKFLDKKFITEKTKDKGRLQTFDKRRNLLWSGTLHFYEFTADWNPDGSQCWKSRFPDSSLYFARADPRFIFT